MNAEEIKKYEGKRVLIILRNNFKYTAVLPTINSNSFSIEDKFGNLVTISCDMIDLISEAK